jgi:hypothetical protein
MSSAAADARGQTFDERKSRVNGAGGLAPSATI